MIITDNECYSTEESQLLLELDVPRSSVIFFFLVLVLILLLIFLVIFILILLLSDLLLVYPRLMYNKYRYSLTYVHIMQTEIKRKQER